MPKIKQPIKLNGPRPDNEATNFADKNTEVPDMIKRHAALRTEMAAMKVLVVANPLCPADERVNKDRKEATEWNRLSPFPFEEFKTGVTLYRGQGLLPTDQTSGIYVADRK